MILDDGGDVSHHLENYNIMTGDGDESVVMFSTTTGSPHTAAITDSLAEDEIAAMLLSRYSGWTDPEIGPNVFEVLASYCVEAMNGIAYMAQTHGNRVAIAISDGIQGENAAEGVKTAAEALGLEIVYDGQGTVAPRGEQTQAIEGIIDSDADWVWIAADIRAAVDLMTAAAAGGFTGQWIAGSSAWHPVLFSAPGDLADVIDGSFALSYHIKASGVNPDSESESPGMREMREAMSRYRPDAPLSDAYVLGWIQGLVTTQILDAAISGGDVTRAGVLAAAESVTVNLRGLGPDLSWNGKPDDDIVRETYIYDIDRSSYTLDATIADENAHNGMIPVKGPYSPYTSGTAANWNYEPCHKPTQNKP